jgi:competence ComEA-like helix-hairpin-helix protein
LSRSTDVRGNPSKQATYFGTLDRDRPQAISEPVVPRDLVRVVDAQFLGRCLDQHLVVEDPVAVWQQVRQLAASDPVLAQDLGVGRPDLGREYDDGGLVDINSAQAKDIATRCGIDLAQAEAIVELRDERGGFANVDEMLVLVDLPVSAWDRIRDRAIIASA